MHAGVKPWGAWHVPYTKEAFGRLKQLFGEVEIETEADRIQKDTITVVSSEIKDSVVGADKSKKNCCAKSSEVVG